MELNRQTMIMTAFRSQILSVVVLLLAGCQSVLVAKSTPTPMATPLPTATVPPVTATPDRAAIWDEIEANWQEVDSLARPHLADGLDCEACHPEDVLEYTRPPNALCLDCHEGSISALYTILEDDGQPVHPEAHLETERCSACHRGHRHVVDPCAGCH